MAKITKDMTIKNGIVMGFVRTNKVGSTCEFEICTVEEWKELEDDEAEALARDALWGSGEFDWGY